jgi:hypothetical protein
MNKPPHTTLVEVVVQENPHQNTKYEDQGRVQEVKVDVPDPGPHDPPHPRNESLGKLLYNGLGQAFKNSLTKVQPRSHVKRESF